MWPKSLRLFGRRRLIMWTVAALFVLMLAFTALLFLKPTKKPNLAYAEARIPLTAPPITLPEYKEIVGRLAPNQTITDALLKQGLSKTLANQIVDCARPVYNLAKVKARQFYWLCFTRDGKFRDFRYPVDDTRYLTVYHDVGQDRFVPVMKDFQFETRLEPVSAAIQNSLFSSVLNLGEKDQLALDLADIFSSDVDFNTDIQRGDSFRVLVEKKYLNGQFVKYGAIVAAAVTNRQKLLTGFRFQDENGKPAYYAPDGRALKRSFLKSPLRVVHITSGFSLARLHPVLKIVRPHLGVDYAAPIGTPVQAVAAGVVISAGRSGGNGNMVKIRHSGGYETMYLHLSRLAVGSGAHVDQGAVVGYVGSSGLSTGPHLDFRILHHGTAINPTKVIFPPGAPVSPAQFGRFAELRDRLIKGLNAK